MTRIGNVSARLRITGDDLDPDEVTRMLNCAPSEASRKGELRLNRGRRPVNARSGIWLLKSPLESSQPLESHIGAILDQLAEDSDVWKSLRDRFDMDIDIGLFLGNDNEEFWLSPDIVKLLGDRGIGVDVDIYALFDPNESGNESV